jgi:hypothetical protein
MSTTQRSNAHFRIACALVAALFELLRHRLQGGVEQPPPIASISNVNADVLVLQLPGTRQAIQPTPEPRSLRP